MDTFAKLRAAERKPYLEETASRRTSTSTAIEKDFCICWTLKRLFALTGIPELRFKAGTPTIVPHNALQKLIRDDYKQMREMFPRPPLSFEEVIERLQRLQERINATKSKQ